MAPGHMMVLCWDIASIELGYQQLATVLQQLQYQEFEEFKQSIQGVIFDDHLPGLHMAAPLTGKGVAHPVNKQQRWLPRKTSTVPLALSQMSSQTQKKL